MPVLVAQIHKLTGGSYRQQLLYKLGVDAALQAINSIEFKTAVINYDSGMDQNFKGFKSPVTTYVDAVSGRTINDYLSNENIYDLIMSGWDKFNQTHEGDADLESHLHYKRWSNAIGHTYPSTFKTWLNTKFWTGTEKQIVALIAGNIVHEYMHNLGFGHAYKWNPTRDHSVPYAVGTIVRQIVDGSYVTGERNQFKRICKRTWRTLWIKKTCKTVAVR
jgi:hypothetical protein